MNHPVFLLFLKEFRCKLSAFNQNKKKISSGTHAAEPEEVRTLVHVNQDQLNRTGRQYFFLFTEQMRAGT